MDTSNDGENRMKYDFIVGVPCSKLKGFTDSIDNYIPSTKEDEAMALAVGAYLVGKNPLVFLQNSGLGNIVDVVTSLLMPYKIQIPIKISIRDSPEHHFYMFRITEQLLKLLELQYETN